MAWTASGGSIAGQRVNGSGHVLESHSEGFCLVGRQYHLLRGRGGGVTDLGLEGCGSRLLFQIMHI